MHQRAWHLLAVEEFARGSGKSSHGVPWHCGETLRIESRARIFHLMSHMSRTLSFWEVFQGFLFLGVLLVLVCFFVFCLVWLFSSFSFSAVLE